MTLKTEEELHLTTSFGQTLAFLWQIQGLTVLEHANTISIYILYMYICNYIQYTYICFVSWFWHAEEILVPVLIR